MLLQSSQSSLNTSSLYNTECWGLDFLAKKNGNTERSLQTPISSMNTIIFFPPQREKSKSIILLTALKSGNLKYFPVWGRGVGRAANKLSSIIQRKGTSLSFSLGVGQPLPKRALHLEQNPQKIKISKNTLRVNNSTSWGKVVILKKGTSKYNLLGQKYF